MHEQLNIIDFTNCRPKMAAFSLKTFRLFVECDLLRKSKSHIHVTKFFDNRNVDNYSWKGWHNNTKTCPSSFFNIIMWQLCPNASYIFLGQKCFPRLILLWQNSKKRSKVFLIHSGIPCMKNKKNRVYCRKPNLILARYYNKAQLYASIHNEKNYSTSLHLLCLIHAFATTRRLTGWPIIYYGIIKLFFYLKCLQTSVHFINMI